MVVEAVDVGYTTVRTTAGLVIPDSAAVILLAPTATPVAKPVEFNSGSRSISTGPGYLRANVRS